MRVYRLTGNALWAVIIAVGVSLAVRQGITLARPIFAGAHETRTLGFGLLAGGVAATLYARVIDKEDSRISLMPAWLFGVVTAVLGLLFAITD